MSLTSGSTDCIFCLSAYLNSKATENNTVCGCKCARRGRNALFGCAPICFLAQTSDSAESRSRRPGYYGDLSYGSASPFCSSCNLGYYRDERAGRLDACVKCPENSNTPSGSSESIEACQCLAGYYRVDNDDGYTFRCEKTPPGTYTSVAGAAACRPEPPPCSHRTDAARRGVLSPARPSPHPALLPLQARGRRAARRTRCRTWATSPARPALVSALWQGCLRSTARFALWELHTLSLTSYPPTLPLPGNSHGIPNANPAYGSSDCTCKCVRAADTARRPLRSPRVRSLRPRRAPPAAPATSAT